MRLVGVVEEVVHAILLEGLKRTTRVVDVLHKCVDGALHLKRCSFTVLSPLIVRSSVPVALILKLS